MRKFIVLLIIIINFIVQSTLLQHFRIFGILPNTALIMVVVFSILWGKNKGAVIGFFTGILQDILLGKMLGVNALIYMLIGYNMGVFERMIFKDNYITPLFFTMISTFLYYIMYYVIMYMAHIKIEFVYLIKNIIPMEVIYNSILSIFIYRILYNITKHSKMKAK